MAVLKMQKISRKIEKQSWNSYSILEFLKLTGTKKRMHSSKRWTQPDSG